MSIKSMTGFARAEGAHEGAAWHWEVRSVNGRGLDVRLRLPSGSELLEPKVREAVARHVTRGSLTISLSSEGRRRRAGDPPQRARARPGHGRPPIASAISPTRRRRASTA